MEWMITETGHLKHLVDESGKSLCGLKPEMWFRHSFKLGKCKKCRVKALIKIK